MGSVDGTKESYADKNIAHFVKDVNLSGLIYKRYKKGDSSDGRFSYELKFSKKRKIVVDMPGLPLEKVRWFQGKSLVGIPRLYVDGGSWLWEFAIDIVKDNYE